MVSHERWAFLEIITVCYEWISQEGKPSVSCRWKQTFSVICVGAKTQPCHWGYNSPPRRPQKCWAVLARYSATALRSQVAHLSSRWWTYFFSLWNAIKWCGYKCLDKIKMAPSWIFFLNWQTYSNILAKAWRVLVTYMKNFRFKPSPVRASVIVCRQRCKIKP